MPTLIQFYRIWNLRTFPYFYSEMATAEEGLFLCLRMQIIFLSNVYLTIPDIVFFIQLHRIKATTNTHRELPSSIHQYGSFCWWVFRSARPRHFTRQNWCVTCSMCLWHLWQFIFDRRNGELYLEVSHYLSFNTYEIYSVTTNSVQRLATV